MTATVVKDHCIARRLGCRDSWHRSSSCAGDIWRAIDAELVLLLSVKEDPGNFQRWKLPMIVYESRSSWNLGEEQKASVSRLIL